ncbi:MAG: hypothetical protein HON94_02685, partial [Methylococcales bacterium]|nr:hypothetical protein [Methylococcales bacterium]
MSRYNLLDRVVWPKQTSIIEPDDPEILSKRNVYKEGNGSSGSFLSEKMNRTVEYESHLEWDIYNIIEQSDEVKFYQEQPFEIPYFLKNKEYAYYPDVLIILNDGRGIVVEIKPLSDMVLFINIKKYNSMIKFCTEKGFGYLMTDKKNCYTDIDNFKTD